MKRIFDLRRLVLTGAVLWMASAALPARAQDPDDLKRGGRDQRSPADRRSHRDRRQFPR